MARTIQAGTVIDGKYRIERIIGRGGMGVVVAAEHLVLRERVALKFMFDGDEQATHRFIREARAAASLKSAHVCRVMDVGTLPDGSPFLVMELLEGRDLAAHLKEHGALSVERAADVLLQVLDALAEAHASGIVHRDLKPANLFLTTRAHGAWIVKILDFGISKHRRSAPAGPATDAAPPSRELTAADVAIGTPAYMSPEQVRSSRDVDGRSDIWAIGAILYELVTGQRMFPGSPLPRLADLLCGRYEPLRVRKPDLPDALERIVARCVRVEVSERYHDLEELADDLMALAPFSPFASARRARQMAGPSLRGPMHAPAFTKATAPMATIADDATTTTLEHVPAHRQTFAVSQVSIETTTCDGYVLAIVRGRMGSRRDALAATTFLADALRSAGVSALLVDARNADGTKDGHAGLWEWIRERADFERFAMVVESTALRRGFDVEAAELGARARAFEDVGEAEAWLRSPASEG